MPDLPFDPPARRFLHICYCCNDGDAAVEFFGGQFAMRNTMSTPMERTHAGLLGLDYEILSQARFMYDRRGPRTSPAIEIQHWVEPAPEGTPSTDPFEVGIKALGIAVPDLDVALPGLIEAGCSLVADDVSPFEARALTMLDPTGTTLEIVEDSALGLSDGQSQMHHIRITVASLADSVPFYEILGFLELDRGEITDGAFLGLEDGVIGEYVTMRLPDEPFQARLVEWQNPASHGRHYENPWHAGLFRVALGVDDTRRSYDEMMAAGAVFDRPPQDVILNGTPVPNMWITFITDPNGIAYEFVQRDRAAFR